MSTELVAVLFKDRKVKYTLGLSAMGQIYEPLFDTSEEARTVLEECLRKEDWQGLALPFDVEPGKKELVKVMTRGYEWDSVASRDYYLGENFIANVQARSLPTDVTVEQWIDEETRKRSLSNGWGFL